MQTPTTSILAVALLGRASTACPAGPPKAQRGVYDGTGRIDPRAAGQPRPELRIVIADAFLTEGVDSTLPRTGVSHEYGGDGCITRGAGMFFTHLGGSLAGDRLSVRASGTVTIEEAPYNRGLVAELVFDGTRQAVR